MLKRKVYDKLLRWKSNSKKALLVTGARQIGKSFIIREFGRSNYAAFVEINLFRNDEAKTALAGAVNAQDFINRVALYASIELIEGDTLIFIDEIQEYPDIMTMVKFLVEDGRFSYAFSGSMLGAEFKGVRSFPVGYVTELVMRPMDFEEFCWAIGIPQETLATIRSAFEQRVAVPTYVHDAMLRNFRTYIVVGGMPEVVQAYVNDGNSLVRVRGLQNELVGQYRQDISKYAKGRELQVKAIFDQIPLQLETDTRRFRVNALDANARYDNYDQDFLWLVNAGVALKVEQVTEAKAPLRRTKQDSKFKLYQSDTGMLTCRYPQSVARAIYLDYRDPNLGGLYENVIAQELVAQQFTLFYFMTKSEGEVDFLFEDASGRVVPLEVKSGRKFRSHAALDKLLEGPGSKIREAFVLSRGNVERAGRITYVPVYMSFCLETMGEAGVDDFIMKPALV